MMEDIQIFFKDLYQNFNDRNIDLVIANMTNDVKWANGMEGGHVYGHDGVRAYWTRQFELVSPNVTPLEIDKENDIVKIKVHQVLHDLNGTLLADEMTDHIFYLDNGKINRFEIGNGHQ